MEFDELKRRRALIYITEEYIKDMLHLPDDYKVLGIYPNPQMFNIEIVVCSPRLNKTAAGAYPPTIQGTWAKVETGTAWSWSPDANSV